MAPHDVSLVSHPLFHTVAQAWQVLASIWVGACVVIVPKFSASRFWDVVTRNGCTRCTMGQFHARALADQHVPSSHPLRYNQPGVSLTSSPRFFEIKGYGAYGMTELISQPIFNDPMSVLDEGSIGRPAPEYEVRLVKETGELAGPGEVGELQVRGVRGLSIFAEYLADPTATAEAFTADGFFRTGDLVQLRPDGAFAFADRLKDMLKVGGENVAASEIEQVIRSEEGVQEVAVVAAPHPMLAEVPVAFVIPTPDAPIDLAERILQACAQRLADFKRPHRVRLVPSLPRSLVNKVAKAELRAQLRAETAGTAEAHSGLSSAGLAGVPVSR
jgi:crotonobetaine/carnitine-CoA ligase